MGSSMKSFELGSEACSTGMMDDLAPRRYRNMRLRRHYLPYVITLRLEFDGTGYIG